MSTKSKIPERKLISVSVPGDIVGSVTAKAKKHGHPTIGKFASQMVRDSVRGIYPCDQCGYPHPLHTEVRNGK